MLEEYLVGSVQEWSGNLRDKDRYSNYRSFKTIFEKETYLYSIDIYCFRTTLSQARFNVLPLNNNLHRYSNEIQKKMCPFCSKALEDEYHVIYVCTMYADLRPALNLDFLHLPISSLLSTQNMRRTFKVAKFLHRAIQRRLSLVKLFE